MREHLPNVGDIIVIFLEIEIEENKYIDISITDLHQNIFLSFCSDEDL